MLIGWKNPNPPPNPPRPDAPTPSASPQDPCRSCNHTLNDHVKHLQGTVRKHIIENIENYMQIYI